MRFLKKGEKKKPEPPSAPTAKGHPELKVISGSQISGRQGQQPKPQQQQPKSSTTNAATEHHVTKYKI